MKVTGLFLFVFGLFGSNSMYGQLNGVYTVGTLGGEDYSSITNAAGFFSDINALGINGNVVLKVTSDLLGETGAIHLNQFAGGYSVKIIPNSPSVKTINHSSCSDDLFTLEGADDFFIDGRYSGWGKFLKFTSNCNSESIINLKGDCKNVTIRDAILLSDNNQSSYTNGGVIHVDEDQTNGCDSLFIYNNDIADFSGTIDLFDAIQINAPNTPSGVISGLRVIGNNIYNANGKGVFIIANDGSVEQAEILRNSFYATGKITGPGTGWAYAIVQVESGSGHQIRANYFGGTAPKCAGTKMDLDITSGTILMTMIRMTDDLSNAQVNQIDSNVFRNMSIMNGTSDKLGAVLLRLEKGNYNIGVQDGNYLGDLTTDASLSSNASIYVEMKDGTNDSYFSFVKSSSDGVINVENNEVGSIQFYNGVNADFAVYLYHSDGSSMNAVNNIVGGVTNSIVKMARDVFRIFYFKGDNTSFKVVKNTISGITTNSIFNDDFYGVHVTDGSGAPTIKQNHFSDITIQGGTESPRFFGIRVDNRNSLIDSNTIEQIDLDSRYTTRQFSAIYCDATNNVATISDNLIQDVSLLNTSEGYGVVGIFTSGSSSNYMIKNNKIQRFELYSTSTSAYLRGIRVNSADINTIQNNVILFDNNNRVSNINIYGIYDYNSNSSGWTNVWHNTVDIRGTCSGTRRTACYYKSQSGDRNIQNNIFNNRRMRNSGNGDNFSMYFASTSGTLVSNYNLLYVEDDFDELVYRSSDRDFSDWQGLGYGANSVTTITPQNLVDFSSGNQLTWLGNDKGSTNLGVGWDYDYSARPLNGGYDMGAFELDNNTLIKALPVQLVGIKSKCQHSSILLNWSTAAEINNSHFTVYRSADGISWDFVKEIEGEGNSSTLKSYQCEVPNMEKESTYFKVEQTDFDGKVNTLFVDVLSCEDSHESCLTLGPNPVYGSSFKLILDPCFFNKEVSVKVYDGLGQKVLNKEFVHDEFGEVSIRLNSFFNPGVYFVRVTYDDRKFTEKLIVK